MPHEAKKLLEKLILPVFLISATFMVTYSSNAINYWESPWNQLSIILACLLPISLIIVCNRPIQLIRKDIRLELYFILLIIILGALNVIFGEQFISNLKGMGLFLISGICIFGSTFFILRAQKTQNIFLWFCTTGLVGIAFNSIYFYEKVTRNDISLFSGNPIPESLTITLLLAGPILLIHTQKSNFVRLFLCCCIFFGGIGIVLLEQRMAVLSLFVIVVIAGFKYIKIFRIFTLSILLIATVSLSFAIKFNDRLPLNIQKTLTQIKSTPVYRMEMYFFALHLLKKEPLFGVGLWAPLTHHLSDYDEKVFITPELNETKFAEFVNYGENTSFHNLLLCMLVQMGVLFTIVYFGLFFYLIKSLHEIYRNNAKTQLPLKLFFLVLVGFFVQSLTVDSIMYPANNFIFHSFLGLIPNLKMQASIEPSISDKNNTLSS